MYIYIYISSRPPLLILISFSCILHLALAGADTQANSGGAGATGLRQTSKTVTWTATAAASIDAHALCGQGGGSGTAIMYKAELTVTKHQVTAAVSGKCGGNDATATGLDEASTPAGTFQFACGTGYSLKATPDTIAASVAATDAGATKTTCCDQDTAGKCGGNAASATEIDEASDPAGTFQFACGTGFTLKKNPEGITPEDASDAAGMKNECCDAELPTCKKK